MMNQREKEVRNDEPKRKRGEWYDTFEGFEGLTKMRD
jgi:hypothetical protein